MDKPGFARTRRESKPEQVGCGKEKVAARKESGSMTESVDGSTFSDGDTPQQRVKLSCPPPPVAP